PYKESSSQVPEGSGNPNPTASAFNPPADQMKTLTVESHISTVSSPVPTACLNDSSKPFSKAILVSKGVANQEKTPSLDNILSLTNSFMATIHQKTDPALLQFCLYSCFLSQVEPKKVSDALQVLSWAEAMQEELL
nr:hypothetical protein [Tanacetum cinerariifolium]